MALPSLDKIKLPKLEEEVKGSEINSAPVDKGLTSKYDWPECYSTDTHFSNDFIDTGWIGQFNLDIALSHGLDIGASDLHIERDIPIAYSVLGDIVFEPGFGLLDEEVMQHLVREVMNHVAYTEFLPKKEADVAYEIRIGPYAGTRFRVNVGWSLGAEALVFRHLPSDIPELSKLGIPQEIIDWIDYPDGVFFICGSTGSGKSTTLASIIRDFQLRESKKIVTIEKPVEFVYPADGKSLIVQREVGDGGDTLSFENGLTSAMRQAPDIIQIGEVRNKEEVQELIRAADTGHLAITTMHTNSVYTTINRIQSLFEGSERAQVLDTLSTTMRGIANQVLIKNKSGGRTAVREILTVNEDVQDFIAKGDSKAIYKYMRDNGITMEDNMIREIKKGTITVSEARRHSSQRQYFDKLVRENNL